MSNIDQTAKWIGDRVTSNPPSPHVAMFASQDKPWFEVYRAAMLELDPRKMRERIVVAKEAFQLRLKDIHGDAEHHAEKQQIEDALNNSSGERSDAM